MKKKVNIPFLISFMVFSLGLVALGLYFLKIKTEGDSFKELSHKVISSSSKGSSKDKEEDPEEGLDYYLIGGVPVQTEFSDLYLENRDVIGWIKIEDTPIDYPVMQTKDDEQYYLHKDFSKEYSFGGCIFAGAGASIEGPSDNIISYGHHMANGSMYHELDKWEKEDFYKEHKYITFDTLRQTGTYEVIAAFRTKIYPDDYEGFVYWTFISAEDEAEYDEFVKNCKDLTPYTINTDAKYGDQLITLSTCAYHTPNGRFVVVAKRIDGQEIDFDKEPVKEIE